MIRSQGRGGGPHADLLISRFANPYPREDLEWVQPLNDPLEDLLIFPKRQYLAKLHGKTSIFRASAFQALDYSEVCSVG